MSVLGLVSKGNLIRKYKARVDNMVFRLHYRVTFLIFFIASILVTAKEFVGKPIQCEGKSKAIKGELLNTYCYIMSTFSMPTEWNRTIGRDTAYPGYGTPNHDSEVVYHSYYLWVPFVLFLQGVLFYFPHFLWKKIEGGIYETVISGISNSTLDAKAREKKNKVISKYMMDFLNRHQAWAFGITFLIFLISSLIVTAKEYFGKPMICTATGVPSNVINTYCYFTSTFSIPKYWNHTLTNHPDSIPYPGVGMGTDMSPSAVRHTYYQWVTFMLFLQALLFYFPRYIWKSLEGGLFRTIIGGLDKFALEESDRAKKHKVLVRYMMHHLQMHKMWSTRFFLCEALNLVNVVGNIYFTNYFLGGTFLTYGTEVMNFSEMDPENRVDPMTRIFPKMAKCTFRKYGASGTLEVHDAFCLLSVNIINEKIYIFVWFWLVALTAVTALWLVYRLGTLVSPQLRKFLLDIRGRAAGKNNLRIITDKCKLGDWFLVYQLGRHMEPTVYGEFLKEFSKQLEDSMATLERKPMLAG